MSLPEPVGPFFTSGRITVVMQEKIQFPDSGVHDSSLSVCLSVWELMSLVEKTPLAHRLSVTVLSHISSSLSL